MSYLTKSSQKNNTANLLKYIMRNSVYGKSIVSVFMAQLADISLRESC